MARVRPLVHQHAMTVPVLLDKEYLPVSLNNFLVSWKWAGRATALTVVVACTLALHVNTRADSVDDYVRARMAKNHIPSVSLAIVRGGKVTKLQSYGTANLEWNARATPDTAFQLASATKPSDCSHTWLKG